MSILTLLCFGSSSALRNLTRTSESKYRWSTKARVSPKLTRFLVGAHNIRDTIELPYLVGKKGLRPPVPKHMPPVLQKLIVECWAEKSETRPDFKYVCKRLEEAMELIKGSGLSEAAVNPSRDWSAGGSPGQVIPADTQIDKLKNETGAGLKSGLI